MNAVGMMLIAAFLWSLYPALIALSGGQIGAPLFVLVIHISCGISAGLFAFFAIKQKKIVWHNLKVYTKSLGFDEWIYLFLIGLMTTLYNFCFFYAMQMTSKAGAAFIIEIWPLFAMFLAPYLIKKTWNKVEVKDYVIGFVALIGVFLVMVGGQDLNALLNADFDTQSIIGVVLAMIGSFCVALSIVLTSEVGNRISKIVLQEDKPSLSCAAIAEIARRLVALPPSLLLLWAFSDELVYTNKGLAMSVLIGFLIFTIGSLAMRVALLNARSSTINMLYYISPVMAIGWLYVVGLADLTPMILIGGALVILANLLIISKNKPAKET